MLTPSVDRQGWSAAGHTVVEIVVDDMPYLVDSVSMELSRQRRDVHLVIHPVFDVLRDVVGELKAVEPVTDAATEPVAGALRESWMHVEVAFVPESEVDQLVADLQRVLEDVREAVEDTGKMVERVRAVAGDLRSDPPTGIAAREADEAAALLEWLAEGRFMFLGYREYRLEGSAEAPEFLRGVPGSGLGILRSDPSHDPEAGRMPEPVRARATERTVLVLAKANSRSTVGHPAYLDHVGIKTFDASGTVVGERLFLGLFTSSAYTEPIGRVPVLRNKARQVLARCGYARDSHAGQSLLDTLDTYPHDELFYAGVDELATMAQTGLAARERRTLRVVARPDTYGRYVSILVWLPRDRYTTAVRERLAGILTDLYDATDVEYFVRIGQSTTARVQFVVHTQRPVDVDVPDLERRLAAAARSWRDDLMVALRQGYADRLRRWSDAYPAAYQEDFDAATGAADLAVLDALAERNTQRGLAEGLDLGIYRPEDAAPEEARLKIYRVGDALSLSHLLPMLTSMGVEVTDERPYHLEGTAGADGSEQPTYIYDFGLRYAGEGGFGAAEDQRRFCDTVLAMWDGAGEVDSFNTLVLAAGLEHREVMVLRAYARYLQQGGTPFSQRTIANALRSNVAIARLLVELFRARFDPDADGASSADGADRDRRQEEITEQVQTALDEVASLDQDRILRSYLAHITATLRTNWFVPDVPGRPARALSLKLEPTLLPDLPLPRPEFEIFVYAPTVEGVHLRFGPVARGGLRWSDRTDDYRTEILGLVKAQMVKNTVIVPVGAKGGFVAKRGADGPTAYRAFVSGLLDLTDNLVGGANVPPPHVVCHDGADSYLVVAADKGTATFSDLANEVAADYGFWLGDAFASGGSVGYDHKAMGITARGAWVSVQRHFRELGVDVQEEDFTVVGIGDMSGDVFGNGMLLSPHLRLVAAFDHRDIFLDPAPDAASSFAERQRLFGLPRSTWQDYDRSLISSGGGVFSRSLKSVPVSPEARAGLGLGEHVRSLTPAELVSAILRAPVDLLWNGGIGTYVKGSDEGNAAVGDKANDAVRVNGAQVRARVVGEGGNLGLTQAGRVEYAQTGGPGGEGGRINTDAIDNSAGVDTSDHEVNLKILLDRLVHTDALGREERNDVLAEMTDEVAALVLRDNDQQNLALANAAANGTSLLHVQEAWMASLEDRGVLSRDVEGLPSTGEVRRRLDAGGCLTSPETAVLMSWTKIELARELIGGPLPDEEYVAPLLAAYFPSEVRERFPDAIQEHPLRREIIVTQLVNELVNGAGTTYWPRLAAETGATATELVRANLVARDLVGWSAMRERIAGLDHQVDAAVQTRMRISLRTLAERLSRWLVARRISDGTAAVERYQKPFGDVLAALPRLLTGAEGDAFAARRDRLTEAGVPADLAVQVAVLEPASMLLGVVEVALAGGYAPDAVVRAHLELGERLGLPRVLAGIVALPRDDRWQSMARASLREDLHAVHAALTAQQLDGAPDDFEERLERATGMLSDIGLEEGADLARLSVAVRALRTLL